ncbi:chromophore lyase CpcT/CpeT [Aquimarina sp. 2201CG1-2-11]|uniref:chromophore lyase CpcT/CpeT n=1 Tax=Aquimarina discodermiae TaxID=3231043 RepID=UPI003461D887
MKQLLLSIFLCIPILFSSCNSDFTKDPELYNLVMLLTGEFSNEIQAENDINFPHLTLKNTRIWENRSGYWMFSEISDIRQNGRVYFQRIIHYDRLDSVTLRSTSYKIPNLKKHQNISSNIDFLNQLRLEDLEIVMGCQMYFKKETSTIYSGKTKKGACTSSIPNVDYILSTLIVSNGKISSWTKGFNKEGDHIWGKIKGPYKYIKVFDN